MSPRLIVLVVIIFGLLIAGMFGFAYLKRAEAPVLINEPTTTATTTYGITRIEAKHFFIDGVHTIVGEILLPTPCDLLTATALVAESMPEQVTYNFSVINNSESCAQVVTAARFSIAATASAAASLTARFMGQPIELNLVEAAPGETPAEFELFIKG